MYNVPVLEPLFIRELAFIAEAGSLGENLTSI